MTSLAPLGNGIPHKVDRMTIKELSTLKIFSQKRNRLAEAPCWSVRDNGLYWVDIPSQKLHFSKIDGTVSSWLFNQKISAVIEAKSGGLILTLAKEIIHFDPKTKISTLLFDIDLDIPSNRSNDAKCDPWGNLWIGTMDDDEEGSSGRLHMMSPSFPPKIILDNIGISNTLAWDQKHNIFYFADSKVCEIYRISYMLENNIPQLGKREIFIKETELNIAPDGSTIDSDGFLWNAKWGGNKVVRYAQNGDISHIIEVPAANVTSCCFGGIGNNHLFITTALDDPNMECGNEGMDGFVYVIELSINGVETSLYG